MNANDESLEDIFTLMGVDNFVSIERPNIDNIHVIFWKKAGIVIPWHPDYSAKQAIIEWANQEMQNEKTFLEGT